MQNFQKRVQFMCDFISYAITMENPSPTTSWIPQGIPTGVFVSNAQTPVQDTVQQPVAPQVQSVVPPVVTPASPIPQAGALDKFFQGLVRFIAKIMGQADPITGLPNTSKAVQKTENIVGKVRNAANQVVEKTSDVVTKATDTVTQATEKIQQVIPPPSSSVTSTPTPEQPTA